MKEKMKEKNELEDERMKKKHSLILKKKNLMKRMLKSFYNH
jgi:hypothetical protein